MKRGVGIEKDRDGILYKNVLATYTHVHALGTPGWAGALVRNAIKFKKEMISCYVRNSNYFQRWEGYDRIVARQDYSFRSEKR